MQPDYKSISTHRRLFLKKSLAVGGGLVTSANAIARPYCDESIDCFPDVESNSDSDVHTQDLEFHRELKNVTHKPHGDTVSIPLMNLASADPSALAAKRTEYPWGLAFNRATANNIVFEFRENGPPRQYSAHLTKGGIYYNLAPIPYRSQPRVYFVLSLVDATGAVIDTSVLNFIRLRYDHEAFFPIRPDVGTRESAHPWEHPVAKAVKVTITPYWDTIV